MPAPVQAVPNGMASPETIRQRLDGLLPAGCRVTDVRYGGEKVTLLGAAASNRMVSDALRALDGMRARPELLSIRQEGVTTVSYTHLDVYKRQDAA